MWRHEDSHSRAGIPQPGFALRFEPGEIDFGPEVRQVGLLRSEGRAELIREHHGGKQSVDDIRLVGKLDAGSR